MILSRTMREADYDELKDEGQVIVDVHNAIKMWNDKQHHHRLWEYALAQKALKTVFGDRKGLLVTDHGCGAGYLSPILYWLGHHVWMYECWTFGSEEDFLLEQMRRVGLVKASLGERMRCGGIRCANLLTRTVEWMRPFVYRHLSTLANIKGLFGIY